MSYMQECTWLPIGRVPGCISKIHASWSLCSCSMLAIELPLACHAPHRTPKHNVYFVFLAQRSKRLLQTSVNVAAMYWCGLRLHADASELSYTTCTLPGPCCTSWPPHPAPYCSPWQEYQENVLQLPVNRRDGIGRLAAVLKLRVQVSHLRALVGAFCSFINAFHTVHDACVGHD